MSTPDSSQNTDNEDNTGENSRTGSDLVSSLSDDDYSCCFNCIWGEQDIQHEEVYVPTTSACVPEELIPLSIISESAVESSEMSDSSVELSQRFEVTPEIHIQQPTPHNSPTLRHQRLIREYRRNQIDIERSLDHPHMQAPIHNRSHLQPNIQVDNGCRSPTSRVSSYQTINENNTINTWVVENRRLFTKDYLRRRTLSVPSLQQDHQIRKPCTCMPQMIAHACTNRSYNVPRYPTVFGQPSFRPVNPQALRNNRAHCPHVHSPLDENCVGLSALPFWSPNVVYGWLVFIGSHHTGFREVYVYNSNLAFVEFSSEVFARDACVHLNGLRLTHSCVLRAWHVNSQYDMPPPYPNPVSEQQM